jgi:hypothetical protein
MRHKASAGPAFRFQPIGTTTGLFTAKERERSTKFEQPKDLLMPLDLKFRAPFAFFRG